MRVLLCVVLCVVGCRERPPLSSLQPVRGRVTANGLPAAQVQLCFHPLDGMGRIAVGTTDAHGDYRLTTWQANDGALAGTYAVTIVWPNMSIPKDECVEVTSHDRLNGQYGDATKTTLRATLVTGPNEVNWSLTLSGSWSFPKRREAEKR